MRNNVLSIAIVLGATGLIASTASAQIEPIGPFDLLAFSTNGFGPFYNEVVPGNMVTILGFVGTAQNPSPSSSSLSVFFGYPDGQGGEAFAGRGDNIVPLAPDGGRSLMDQDVLAFFTLDVGYCPDEVSIYFEAFDSDVYQIQGDFKHFCVPEPGGATLLVLGWGVIFRRRGVRR